MSSLDNNNIFSSGPHSFQVQSWQRQLERRAISGLDGELILDMGLRARQIIQKGRLQSQTAQSLSTLRQATENFIDGKTHTLVDNHGNSFANVVMEKFEMTPVQTGCGFWCDYTITYWQLP